MCNDKIKKKIQQKVAEYLNNRPAQKTNLRLFVLADGITTVDLPSVSSHRVILAYNPHYTGTLFMCTLIPEHDEILMIPCFGQGTVVISVGDEP